MANRLGLVALLRTLRAVIFPYLPKKFAQLRDQFGDVATDNLPHGLVIDHPLAVDDAIPRIDDATLARTRTLLINSPRRSSAG